MKNIEELYKSIFANDDLKAQYIEAVKENKLDEFLKTQGCSATTEDIWAFIDSKKELSLDELDSVAGGMVSIPVQGYVCPSCGASGNDIMAAPFVGIVCNKCHYVHYFNPRR